MNGTCNGKIFWVPAPGALGRGQKFNFINIVIWRIKIKGMSSRPGCTEKYYPTMILVTLEWDQRVQLSYDFFESVGICDSAPSNVF